MDYKEALAVFLIIFTCSLVILGACSACVRACTVASWNARVQDTYRVFQQPPLPCPRKLKDPRVISHPGGETSIGIVQLQP